MRTEKYKLLSFPVGKGWGFRQSINSKGKLIGIGGFYPNTTERCEVDEKRFHVLVKGSGMCLICGSLDLDILEEHHVDKEKMPDFTITLCPNDHRRIHHFIGKEGRWK